MEIETKEIKQIFTYTTTLSKENYHTQIVNKAICIQNDTDYKLDFELIGTMENLKIIVRETKD